MKKAWAVMVVALVSLSCAAWQLEIPLSSRPPSDNPGGKKGRSTTRTLTGAVLDKSDKPISGAVVYLKNEKTLSVKSFFAQQDGSYRFPQLDRNIDYEVYAEFNGKRSGTKTVSQFDDRSAPNIILRIDVEKESKSKPEPAKQ